MLKTKKMITDTKHRNSTIQWYSIIGLLLIYLIVYSIGLANNQYGNKFYAAAAQAGAHSWKAFFYGASDFSSTITVDKPPLSLWPASLAIRIFGLNSWSILFPQVIIGLLNCWIIYSLVRRYTNHLTAWFAGFAFASCPLVFIMFRFNNPDAMMLLLVTLAMYTLVRGIGVIHGENSWLAAWQWNLLTGIIMGLSFLTKQLEGLMTIPALILAILCCISTWKHKISALLYNLLGLLIGAGWWTSIIELTPADQRPYIGGSSTNDFIQLTLFYNGIGRFTGSSFHHFARVNETNDLPGIPNFSRSNPGLGRFLWSFEATQIGLLTSLAFIGIILGYFWLYRWQKGKESLKALYIITSTWGVSLWLAFSFMGKVFHPYYPLIIATPLAIISSFALIILWNNRNQWWAKKIILLILIVETATAVMTSCNGDDLTPGYISWIIGIIGIISILITIMMMKQTTYAYSLSSINPWIIATWIGVLFITFAPSLYYLASSYPRSIITGLPLAGPGTKKAFSSTLRQNTPADFSLQQEVAHYIEPNAKKYTWLAGGIGFDASDYQLATGYSVMPIGGFAGFDPCPTLDRLKQITQSHQMHYFILSDENNKNAKTENSENNGSPDDMSTKSKNYPFSARAHAGQPKIYAYITQNFPYKEFSNQNLIFRVYDLTHPLSLMEKQRSA